MSEDTAQTLKYPQTERDAWALASAAKSTAIWAVIDANHAALWGPSDKHYATPERMIELQQACDWAVAAALAARRKLDEAEAAYYAAGGK